MIIYNLKTSFIQACLSRIGSLRLRALDVASECFENFKYLGTNLLGYFIENQHKPRLCRGTENFMR